MDAFCDSRTALLQDLSTPASVSSQNEALIDNTAMVMDMTGLFENVGPVFKNSLFGRCNLVDECCRIDRDLLTASEKWRENCGRCADCMRRTGCHL